MDGLSNLLARRRIGPDGGADLRGADLSEARLTCISLRGAMLDDANLTGAHLSHVDLSGASLRGACLERTTFHQVSLVQASLAGAHANASVWRHADLTVADCTGLELREALMGTCLFERADLTDADLSLIRLIDCTCTEATFRGTTFNEANTAGSRFARAQFAGARQFFRCREIVVEILSREIGDDLERAKLVGALAMHADWCYPEWAQILTLQPHYRQVAVEIFRQYPESGFLQALRAASSR
jgi:uncharacterized protein YjbI with pentapeptide repeats